MPNTFIIFIIFISILMIVFQGAIGVYIVGEKGKNIWLGFIIGAFIPIIGLITLTMIKPTNKVIVNEMYERKLMNLKDYKNTKEFKLKK